MELRQLTTSNYDAYFTLRLDSLRRCPEMFASDATAWQNAPKHVIDQHLQASETHQSPIIGAWHADTLIGLAGLKPESRPAVAHKATLWGLYVEPSHRRLGIGSQLLAFAIATAEAMEQLEQIRAVVTANSEAAMRIFKKNGFSQFGREPRAKCLAGQYYDQVYFWHELDEVG